MILLWRAGCCQISVNIYAPDERFKSMERTHPSHISEVAQCSKLLCKGAVELCKHDSVPAYTTECNTSGLYGGCFLALRNSGVVDGQVGRNSAATFKSYGGERKKNLCHTSFLKLEPVWRLETTQLWSIHTTSWRHCDLDQHDLLRCPEYELDANSC